MNWTSGRLKEKEVREWFMPQRFRSVEITENDWESFFKFSERGEKLNETLGVEAILEAKKWTDVHMNMYQEGVSEGSVPYFTLLGGEEKSEIPPRAVVDYMKKDMFGGIDAETIEKLYQEING